MHILLISVMGILTGGCLGGIGGAESIAAIDSQEAGGRRPRQKMVMDVSQNQSLNYLQESIDSDSVAIDIQEGGQQINPMPLSKTLEDLSKISHNQDQTEFVGNVTVDFLTLHQNTEKKQYVPVGSVPTRAPILVVGHNKKDTMSSDVTYPSAFGGMSMARGGTNDPSAFGGMSSVRGGTNERTGSTAGWGVSKMFDPSHHDGRRSSDVFSPGSLHDKPERRKTEEPVEIRALLIKKPKTLERPASDDVEDLVWIETRSESPGERPSCWRRLFCCAARRPRQKNTSDASIQTDASLPPLCDLAQTQGWLAIPHVVNNQGEPSQLTLLSSDQDHDNHTRNTSSLSNFQSNGPRVHVPVETIQKVREEMSKNTQFAFPRMIFASGNATHQGADTQSPDTATFRP